MPRPFDGEVEDQRIRVVEHGVVRPRCQHGFFMHADQRAQRGRVRLVAGRVGAVEQVEHGLARARALEHFRHVAPVLAQRIGHQRVLRHAQAERMAVQRLAGVARHVPVVGDLVVVADHVAGDVGQHPAHVLQVLAEQRELGRFRVMPDIVALLRPLAEPVAQHDRIAAEDHARGLGDIAEGRHVGGPQHVGPDHDVHAQVLAERQQLPVEVFRGEARRLQRLAAQEGQELVDARLAALRRRRASAPSIRAAHARHRRAPSTARPRHRPRRSGRR